MFEGAIAFLWGQLSTTWGRFTTWLQNLYEIGLWGYLRTFLFVVGTCLIAFLGCVLDILSFLFNALTGTISLLHMLATGAPVKPDPSVIAGFQVFAFANHFLPLTEWVGVEISVILLYSSGMAIKGLRWVWKWIYP